MRVVFYFFSMFFVARTTCLAVDDRTVSDAFGQIERISSWPAQTLIIGLFTLILVSAYWGLRLMRKDVKEANALADKERNIYYKELQELYNESKQDRREMIKILERSVMLFERIERNINKNDKPWS
jgi:hypothetical protein